MVGLHRDDQGQMMTDANRDNVETKTKLLIHFERTQIHVPSGYLWEHATYN